MHLVMEPILTTFAVDATAATAAITVADASAGTAPLWRSYHFRVGEIDRGGRGKSDSVGGRDSGATAVAIGSLEVSQEESVGENYIVTVVEIRYLAALSLSHQR